MCGTALCTATGQTSNQQPENKQHMNKQSKGRASIPALAFPWTLRSHTLACHVFLPYCWSLFTCVCVFIFKTHPDTWCKCLCSPTGNSPLNHRFLWQRFSSVKRFLTSHYADVTNHTAHTPLFMCDLKHTDSQPHTHTHTHKSQRPKETQCYCNWVKKGGRKELKWNGGHFRSAPQANTPARSDLFRRRWPSPHKLHNLEVIHWVVMFLGSQIHFAHRTNSHQNMSFFFFSSIGLNVMTAEILAFEKCVISCSRKSSCTSLLTAALFQQTCDVKLHITRTDPRLLRLP